MRILICGTRNRQPVEILRKIIDLFPVGTVVIHGGARGVDSTAGQVASQRGLKTEVHLAEWDIYGPGAGPKRNQQMLEAKPDIVIAVHNEPGLGKGTADMVRRSRGAGLPVFVFGC